MKVIKIKYCIQCPYVNNGLGLSTCDKVPNTGNWLHDYPEIPTWCPLEDY